MLNKTVAKTHRIQIRNSNFWWETNCSIKCITKSSFISTAKFSNFLGREARIRKNVPYLGVFGLAPALPKTQSIKLDSPIFYEKL